MDDQQTIGSGNSPQLNEAVERVYAELNRIAASFMVKERPGQTLQKTALVHEAYSRLLNNENLRWENQAHFLALAAGVMRQILVDAARRKTADKRGNGAENVTLYEEQAGDDQMTLSTLELDGALEKLSKHDEEMARIVELRFFAGINHNETMDVLGISRRTLDKKWNFARIWLKRELGSS
jgi:RNA polymerase sigma factor (TIGR02999 family)